MTVTLAFLDPLVHYLRHNCKLQLHPSVEFGVFLLLFSLTDSTYRVFFQLTNYLVRMGLIQGCSQLDRALATLQQCSNWVVSSEQQRFVHDTYVLKSTTVRDSFYSRFVLERENPGITRRWPKNQSSGEILHVHRRNHSCSILIQECRWSSGPGYLFIVLLKLI